MTKTKDVAPSSPVRLSWIGRVSIRFPRLVLGGPARIEPPPGDGIRRESTRQAGLFLLLIAFLVQAPTQHRRVSAGTPKKAAAHSVGAAPRLPYKVVNSYPHDPTAFLQGLVWYDGGFYESTGLPGQSTLRRVKFPSGQVTKSVSLSQELFGEGLAMVGDELVQLTWQTHRGFVYDRETFALLREFGYNTEGWGLTYDGTNLILSDGSDGLTYLDPHTYAPLHRLSVTWDGRPQFNLNELEFIEGEIWANIWQTDFIVRIDPATGQVASYIDLKGLLPANVQRSSEDVLNGIAYDSVNHRVFVSGKRWPRLFEIKLKTLVYEKEP